MKKVYLILSFLATFLATYSQEIIKDSTSSIISDSSIIVTTKHSEPFDFTNQIGRYKLYPTNNTYNFLKLDTQTGRIWAVQWNTSYEKIFEQKVNSEYLVNPLLEKVANGRFELQKTDNIWNFLLIDTATGIVYQVQWGFEESSNMLIRIY